MGEMSFVPLTGTNQPITPLWKYMYTTGCTGTFTESIIGGMNY